MIEVRWLLSFLWVLSIAHTWLSPATALSQQPQALTQDYQVEALFSLEAGQMALDDVKHLSYAPFQASKREWLYAGLAGTTIAGTMIFFDSPLRDEINRHSNDHAEDTAMFISRFGAEYSWAAIGLFEAGGLLADDQKAQAVAHDAIISSLIANGIICSSMKGLTGRSRPDHEHGAHYFKPFSHNFAFPSGHTTQAFAVASTIAANYDSIWIQSASYGIASAVGASMMVRDAHWASDVMVGALLGTTIGRIVTNNNLARRLGLQLQIAPDTAAVEFTRRF